MPVARHRLDDGDAIADAVQVRAAAAQLGVIRDGLDHDDAEPRMVHRERDAHGADVSADVQRHAV